MNPNDLLSISHFAELTGVSRSTLIYYDEAGVFHPVERGENGYRYYSPQQFIIVNLVRVLSDLQVPLKQIEAIKDCRTPESIFDLLTEQHDVLEEKIKWLKSSQGVIDTLRELIRQGLDADETRISIERRKSRKIVFGPKTDFGDDDHFYNAFIESCAYFKEHNWSLSYPIAGWFESLDSFLATPSEPDKFISLNPAGDKKTLGGLHVIGYTRGYYGVTNDIPKLMTAYLKKHKLIPRGPVYKIYLQDEVSVVDPDNYLLETSIPVEDTDAARRLLKSKK